MLLGLFLSEKWRTHCKGMVIRGVYCFSVPTFQRVSAYWRAGVMIDGRNILPVIPTTGCHA
jgi:hypothetical protein